MRFQKTIKRMIALGTGALMLGSSVMAAADLGAYPAPFIKDGKFNGVLIVGNKAAAEDVIGISDIISSLQFAATKKVAAGGGASLSAEGDVWTVGTSTKILELSENLDSGNNREAIATITTNSFVDDIELPGLLAAGSISNSKGTFEYDQRLYFEDATTGYVIYTENSDDDVTADFLYFPNGKQIARYELEFTTQPESDVDDSAGSASTTGLFLTDYEDISLTMLGKQYDIVTAKRVSTAGNNVVLTLMGGAKKDTLVEQASKNYEISGKAYEVSLNYVDTDEAQFSVNGQLTRKLKDGDTDKLADGTTIGVTDILYQDYAGGIHSATFFIGAQKVELRDTAIADTASSNDVKIDDETIDDTAVTIEGTDDNTTFKIDKISINMSADDDFYVPAGGKLSAAIAVTGSEVDALFTRNWDVEYKGLSKVSTAKIEIKASGSDQYNLLFNDGSGNQVKVPVLNSPSGSVSKFGDDDNNLVVQENKTIHKDDYFILTDESDSDGERQTYALRYRGADDQAADNPVVKFDNLGTGERIERPFSAASSETVTAGPSGSGTTAATKVGEIKLGGGTFNVYNVSSTKADDFNILVDLDAQGLDNQRVSINTKEGARIDLINGTGGNLTALEIRNPGVVFNLTTPNTDDFDDLVPAQIAFNLTTSSAEVRMNEHDGSNLNYQSPQGDDDNSYAYTAQGTFVKFYSPSSDPNEVSVDYPSVQRTPLVYVTGQGVSFSETAASSTDAVTVQRIDVGAAKLASEVSDVMAVNSILVGGPCANAATATVMGNPADCTAGFEPGVGKIQLFEHSNGNVAMLVAGYNAVDTRNAAAVVANYKDYASLKGTSVEVKKVNNQLTVAAPAPKVVAPVVADTTA